jgi:hypothetical protein
MKVTCNNPVQAEIVETFPHLRKITQGSPAILLVTGKNSETGKYIGTILWYESVSEENCNNIGYTSDWNLNSEPFTGSVTIQG